MKAVLLEGPNKVRVGEIAVPKCPSDGFLLKVSACGLCGSDIRTIRNGSGKIKQYPVIMGHEITGVVAEVGSTLHADYKVGDKVAVGSTASCGECYFCKKGQENLCSDIKCLGNGPVDFPGGFAEYVAVPHMFIEKGPVKKLTNNVDIDVAALAEPLTTVMNSHDNITFDSNDTAVIIGAGPIGALHIANLKLNGIGTTIIADVFEERLALVAAAASPDIVVNVKKENLVDVIKKVTHGRGADIVIVACSVKAVQEQAFSYVRKGGHVIFFGGLPDQNRMIQLDSNVLHYSQLTLHGTYISRPHHFFKAIELITQNKIDLSKLVTKMKMDDFDQAMALAESGKVLKVVINP
ncbi:alcohol dehydrogenase catalytic domain-containing protein [Propionispira raffinosivorans]|jgi:L-iditol 2-dehydrogenase|uniref:alcohol dehydrogenase catalytic domain-containing protein n=1 Tax=Propionispira raffinosivorans TaxID=86959 RepID=UPI000380A166|nr:alcohol dehydrogenase catalytic domain-containing protein [Propionispira raffinosivorans]